MNTFPTSIPGVPSQIPTPKGVWEFWEGNRHDSQKYNGTKTGIWDEQKAISSWLSAIGETDPDTINAVLARCETDSDARAYFLRRAAETDTRPNQTEPTNSTGETEMSLTITENTSVNFEPCPAGSYPARCIVVADLGTQESEYQGETKHNHKVLLQFEICDDDTRRDDGLPYVLSKRYTASLHEKAALRKDLASWRGRDFTAEELAGFNVKNILGKPCIVAVTHATKGDRTYANIASIMSLPKGMACPANTGEVISFDLSDPDPVAFDKLSQRVQEQIKLAPEYRTATIKSTPSGDGDLDDDICF